jgi:hypothetical protein
MFGFRSGQEPAREKMKLDEILSRHNANLAAERKPAARSDLPPSVFRQKAGFGRRSVKFHLD